MSSCKGNQPAHNGPLIRRFLPLVLVGIIIEFTSLVEVLPSSLKKNTFESVVCVMAAIGPGLNVLIEQHKKHNDEGEGVWKLANINADLIVLFLIYL